MFLQSRLISDARPLEESVQLRLGIELNFLPIILIDDVMIGKVWIFRSGGKKSERLSYPEFCY